MKSYIWKNIFVVLVLAAILTAGVSFALRNKNYLATASVSSGLSSISNIPDNVIVPPQKLSNPPQIVKAVYVTAYSAGSKKYLNYLESIFQNTEINAVVVDIKGSNGYVSYASGVEDVAKYGLYNSAIKNIDLLVNFLHSKNIYVIGRIACFEDPIYSKARPELAIYNKIETVDLTKPVLWQDNNGLSWLDPASKDVWNYDISLAHDALSHGFDEINFDYIRFPSDGKAETIGYPVYDGKTAKAEVIKEFFSYMRQQLAGEKISADLFGQTTVNKDDMGIGQIIENAFENFDYVSPMVYPSHYANNFIGFLNPADHPYEVVKYSMGSALAKEKAYLPQVNLAKFRPWLQDFNMGADYTSAMVQDEIRATEDSLGADYAGFMLWNPSNIYTQDAVLKK